MSTVEVSENWMACMNAMAKTLKEQGLDDIRDNVRVQSDPMTDDHVRPGCYVTPADRIHRTATVSRDDIGYGCIIAFVRGATGGFGGTPERTAKWHEIAARLFSNKRLDDLTLRTGDSCLPCKIEATRQGLPAEWGELKQARAKWEGVHLIIRAWVREDRD